MPKLYEIWRIDLSDIADWKWGSYTNKEYPLLAVLSVFNLNRDEVISINLKKLQLRCDRLNFCACEDEKYEIRAKHDPEIFPLDV